MTRSLIRLQLAACIALLAAPSVSAGAVPDGAKSLLETSGVKGGLVVVIGCDAPALLMDLRAAGPCLVHGLDADPDKIAAARKYLRQKDLYGPVTASRLCGTRLPYVDGVVNLIVVTGPTDVPAAEMTRVLAPGGVIADVRGAEVNITRKNWPAELDEWTHYLHDASNNAVSSDTRVGPPQGLRWTCGPEFARSHEHFASMSAMVTAGGRVFSIIDEGPIRSVYAPPQWNLVARDAFSGVLLWKRPIANWESHLRGFRSGPPEIGRRLVAERDRVYVSLGLGQPVTVLDAATGKTLRTLAGTGGARELLLAEGVLYVLADDVTLAQHEERKKWIKRVWPTLDIWYRFPRKALSLYGTQRVVAIQVGTGERLWQRKFAAPGEVLPATMAVDDGRLCLQTVSHVLCLDAVSGEERWRTQRPVATSRFSWSTPTMVIRDGVVLSLDRAATANVGKSPPARGSEWIISSGGRNDRQDARLLAFSLADGSELWRAPASENYNVPGDVFVITIAVTGTRRRSTGCSWVAAASSSSIPPRGPSATTRGCGEAASTVSCRRTVSSTRRPIPARASRKRCSSDSTPSPRSPLRETARRRSTRARPMAPSRALRPVPRRPRGRPTAGMPAAAAARTCPRRAGRPSRGRGNSRPRSRPPYPPCPVIRGRQAGLDVRRRRPDRFAADPLGRAVCLRDAQRVRLLPAGLRRDARLAIPRRAPRPAPRRLRASRVGLAGARVRAG